MIEIVHRSISHNTHKLYIDYTSFLLMINLSLVCSIHKPTSTPRYFETYLYLHYALLYRLTHAQKMRGTDILVLPSSDGLTPAISQDGDPDKPYPCAICGRSFKDVRNYCYFPFSIGTLVLFLVSIFQEFLVIVYTCLIITDECFKGPFPNTYGTTRFHVCLERL